MIPFNCNACGTSFTVPKSRAGQRTTCPVCRAKLTVPEFDDDHEGEPEGSTTLNRPPAKVVIGLIAVAMAMLVGFGLLLNWLTPYPTKDAVERSLRLNLPPGYEDLRVENYEPKAGNIKFRVKYREFGDLMGVVYDVTRFVDGQGNLGSRGPKVEVIGRRQQWDHPTERWLMVHALFDHHAKIVDKRVTAADATEGPLIEQRARQIVLALNASF